MVMGYFATAFWFYPAIAVIGAVVAGFTLAAPYLFPVNTVLKVNFTSAVEAK